MAEVMAGATGGWRQKEETTGGQEKKKTGLSGQWDQVNSR